MQSRRQFLAKAGVGMFASQILPFSMLGKKAPSNRLRLAGFGLGGMGMGNMRNCSSEEIVAVCDVDASRRERALAEFPQARAYNDYRHLLESEEDLDGVIVATPDHTHAVITMAALKKGLHVYCQKPLTHSVAEARSIAQAAREAGVQTQMGNQGRSSEHIRLLKEWLDDGVIGAVQEVHAWTDRPVGGDPWSTFPVQARPKETPPVPEGLDWDLWIGPASMRPYHPIYHPMTWRAFYDFGTGPLGDMGCHILDPSFYALDLVGPSTLEGSTTHWEPEVAAETYPRASMARYRFPARGNKPELTLNWYDGRLLPFRPEGLGDDVELPSSGALLVGENGFMLHHSHGAGGLRILPDEKMRAYMPNRPKKTIPRVKGSHESDWIRACKTGESACSNFEYGAALTEMVLLGVVALRVPNARLRWDHEAMRFTNNQEANALIDPASREGWAL